MNSVRFDELMPGQIVKAANPFFRYLIVKEQDPSVSVRMKGCNRVRFVAIPGYSLNYISYDAGRTFEVLSPSEVSEWMEYCKTDEYELKLAEAEFQIEQMMAT